MNTELKAKIEAAMEQARTTGGPKVMEALQEAKKEIERLETSIAGREELAARTGVNTLSYSEKVAIRAFLAEMKGDASLLVASRVADVTGVTRSVIVTALRKLESAGAIRSRSLGMKGTHVTILNPTLRQALAG